MYVTEQDASGGKASDLWPILVVLSSNLCLDTDYPEVCHWFLKRILGYLKICHDRFLSHHFQFIFH
jgi:hypothetical protein